MVVSSNDYNKVIWLYNSLSNYFTLKQIDINKLLGYNVKYDPNKRIIEIDKNDYTQKLVNQYQHLLIKANFKPQHTPLDDKVKLIKPTTVTDAFQKSFPFYRHIIGSLNYLSCTMRPDISFPTNYLARFMESYNDTHTDQTVKVLNYLQYHPHASIQYCNLDINPRHFIINNKPHRMIPNQLYVFVDADWASMDLDERKSTSGYLIFLNGGLISWKSCQQRRTAGSSTEAEYIALYEAVKEVIWLKNILEELNIFTVQPVIIFEDNTSTIRASSNPVEHSKLKHLSINYHSIRDYVKSKDIILYHIQSCDQLADILTKGHNSINHLSISNRFINLMPVNNFKFSF